MTADLPALADRARAHGRIGIDTEFMSEGRYWAQLCVVQVVVDGEGADGAVHTAVLDAIEGFDSGPLAEVLADPGVEVVLHAGSQDVAILNRCWDTSITSIFDTQIAAGFTGTGAQLAYGRLLDELLDLRLEKSAGFTRWDVRPLTDEQVEYARGDVLHLLALADALQARLEEKGRLQWALEECRRLESASDIRDPDVAYRRLPRVGQLRPRARAVAKEVAAWRERTARDENRPLGSVLSDVALMEVAKRQPRAVAGLEQIRGIHGGIIRRRGARILEAVGAGMAATPIEAEETGRPPPAAGDLPIVSLCEALVRSVASGAGLAYELVASRGDLQAIVAGSRRGDPEPSVRTLQGWRRELVGQEVLALLAGRRALSVGDDRRLSVESVGT